MRPLLLLVLASVALLASAQTPPTLPLTGFFADVRLTLASLLPYIPSSSLAYQLEGQVYYVPQQNVTVFYIADPETNHRLRQVITPDWVYEIDLPTGQCTLSAAAQASQPYQQYFAPTFLKDMNFGFMANEYLQQEQAFIYTQHWQNAATVTPYMQYWHNLDSLVPFRISWDLINPVRNVALTDLTCQIIVEFSSVVSDLNAVSNLAWLTSIPHSCSSSAAKRIRTIPQRIPPVAPLISASGQNGTAWPQQWHATSAYTGNSLGLFGFTGSVEADVDDPTFVAFELQGNYYYDWPNLRECNVWSNVFTGDQSKTLIVNGTYYIVNLATGSCTIVPIAPVNGPLKYDWPTRIPYIEQQFLQAPGSYLRANHYQDDVLGIGIDHAFNYWSDQSGSPLQFQGPVLEFPPYGQSMMVWRQAQIGLEGVDVVTIFSVPDNCTHVGPTHPDYVTAMAHLRPMITMHNVISKLLSE